MNNEQAIKLFEETDVNHNGKLDIEEFHSLMCKLENNPETKREKTDFYFRGLDQANQGFVSQNDFFVMISIMKNEGKIGRSKLHFRCADLDRDSQLSIEEAYNLLQFQHFDNITREDIETILFEKTGKKESMVNFAVYYKLVSGDDIDLNTNPYEGNSENVAKKSGCCLIL